LITIGADRSERVIFPFGLYSASGFWYCACVDDARGHNVSLRADRFVSVARLEGRARPDHIPLDAWLKVIEHDDGTGLPLRARVTARRMTSFALQTLFERITPDDSGGGMIEGAIPRAEIGWYAAQLLAVAAGTHRGDAPTGPSVTEAATKCKLRGYFAAQRHALYGPTVLCDR